MNQGHRLHTVLALLEGLGCLGIFDLGSLKAQEAADDLEVVLDPMMDLLQEHLFLIQR